MSKDDKTTNGLLDLFNLKCNQEVKKHCQRLVATGDDMARDHSGPNHRKHGPHIHYSRETLANAQLVDVWAKICAKPPRPPASLHIPFFNPRPK
jgi:hypothetical protein